MTFLETFAIPTALSIFANYNSDVIKSIFKKDTIDLYKESFVKAMLNTIETSTAFTFFDDDTFKELSRKIKEDKEILFLLIENYSKSKNKNFLNIIESGKNEEFTEELLRVYDIKRSDISDNISLTNFLVNYKIEFFKVFTTNPETLLIFKEVLKIDNVMDILKKIDIQTTEFAHIKNILLAEHTQSNAVYKKNKNEYDGYIKRKFEYLELAGFSPKISGKDIFMKLSDVFIPLHIDKNNSRNTNGNKHQSIKSILKEDALVILGDPGAGKSTLLKYLATYIAESRDKDWLFKETIPVFIKVSEYADWYKKYQKSLFDYLIEFDTQYSDLIKENFEYSNLLILIDGLDEITDTALRNQVVSNIVDLKSRYPQNKYIVTSRLIGYRETSLSGNFSEAKLLDFDENEIKTFAINWYKSIANNKIDSTEGIKEKEKEQILVEYEEIANALFNSISRNPSVIKFARNPLLMTIVAMIYYQAKKLPNKRVELYDIATETFLENWVSVRFAEDSKFKDKGTILEILPYIAFNIHQDNSKGLISEDDFKKDFLKIYQEINGENIKEAKNEFNEFKDFLEKYTGFFYRKDIEGNLYGFVHLTFEEYLSALELKSKWDLNELELYKYVFDPRWTEVIRLAVANIKISNKGMSGRAKATNFINDIFNIPDNFEEADRLLQLVLLILSDDIEINNDKKEIIIVDFIDVIKKCEYPILLKSFSKLFSEVLYSIYKNDFLNKIKEELKKKETLFLENITYIFLDNDDEDTNKLLNKLFLDEETKKQTFDALKKHKSFKNNFLRSKPFLEMFKKYLVNNQIYDNVLFGEYIDLIDCGLFSQGRNNAKKLIDMFKEEKDDMFKKELYYHIIKLIMHDSTMANFIHSQFTEDDEDKDSFIKAIIMFQDNNGREEGQSRSVSFHNEEILEASGNKKLIYDLVNLKVLKVHNKTHIGNSQFKGYSKEKKKLYKFYIDYLKDNKCCPDSIKYFITHYRENGNLLNFFGWENFLFENFSKNYIELSIILLENVHSLEISVFSMKDYIKKHIIESDYFDNLIPPVKLFFLTSFNEVYDNHLIDECLEYFRSIDSEKKKEKEGTYYLLYKNLNPYNI